MSDVQASAEQMNWNEGEELVNYRQVSRLALLSFVGGLASFLGYASPVLWLVPVVGVVLAVTALVAIRKNSNLTGAGIATFSLAVCAFNSVAAPVQKITRMNRLSSIAQTHFDTWVGLVRKGDRPQAYEMTLTYAARNPVGANLQRIYGKKEIELAVIDPLLREQSGMMIRTKEAEMNTFFGSSGCKLLLSSSTNPKFLGVKTIVPRIESELITLHYQVPFKSHDEEIMRDLFVEMERRVRKDIGESHWRIVSLTDPIGTDSADPMAMGEDIGVPDEAPPTY